MNVSKTGKKMGVLSEEVKILTERTKPVVRRDRNPLPLENQFGINIFRARSSSTVSRGNGVEIAKLNNEKGQGKHTLCTSGL